MRPYPVPDTDLVATYEKLREPSPSPYPTNDAQRALQQLIHQIRTRVAKEGGDVPLEIWGNVFFFGRAEANAWGMTGVITLKETIGALVGLEAYERSLDLGGSWENALGRIYSRVSWQRREPIAMVLVRAV